jgi:DNA (cytosine-5)-methyltransferase 1
VCSGIEAATAAWHHMGWQPAAFSEIEPFPSAVLAHHYPNVPNLGDMTKYEDWNVGQIDLLVGGTPCQAFSVAGLRGGLSDARGNLSLVFCKMADHFDPEYVLWENVPGVLSSTDNAFGCFLAGLCGASEPLTPGRKWSSAGVVSGPKRTVAWRVLDAQFFGVAQRRRRVFVLAVRGAGNWAAARALFPVGEGVFWNSAPSRKAREAVAGTLEASLGRSRGAGTPASSVIPSPPDTVGTLCSDSHPGAYTGQDAYTGRLVPHLAHALRGEGFDASEDGTGRGTPLVPVTFSAKMSVPQTDVGLCQTLQAKNPTAVAPSLTASNDPSRSPQSSEVTQQVWAVMQATQAVAFQQTTDCLTAAYGTKWNGNASATNGSLFAAQAMQVRRLTPVECERLQGFPDNFTAIPWRKAEASDCPDGPRYKALGNSMAVPVMRWLGERIQGVQQ